jgi:hypothetical protein
MGDKRNACSIWWEMPEGNGPVGRPTRRKVILKWILEKQNGLVLSGLIWLRIGTSGGLL